MIQGVIFDFDNTLYDYEICNINALNKIFTFISSTYSIDINTLKTKYDNINKNIKVSNNYANKFNKAIYFKQLLETLSINLVELDRILTIYETEFSSNIKIYDGLLEFIQLLKTNNIKIGLLSNNLFLQQYNKLKVLNILEYFDFIQTTEEVGHEKPSILAYLTIINKMNINKDKILMIGDNYSHDIVPALYLGLTPFLFKNDDTNMKIINKYFEFGSFINLKSYLETYFKSENELIYLSKYFGQSELNVQGQGGNISVKSNDLLLIKSSGYILGNVDKSEGFCVVSNAKCNELLDESNSNLELAKIFGYRNPSMETFFHSFMKKYTVHIHFTLSNIFLCTNNYNIILDNLTIKHKLIDYYLPGLVLANKIKLDYVDDCHLYFLKNHGIIITSDTFDDIFKIYKEVFDYFNQYIESKYTLEYNTFMITEYVNNKFNKSIVCRLYSNLEAKYITNIKYCFPDLAVYIQNIQKVNDIYGINSLNTIPEVIIYNENIYLLADNLIKLYCMTETLNLYNDLCLKYDELEIISEKKIQNMEEEKYRKSH